MSFAVQVKNELCENGLGKSCCMKAELAAFFLFGARMQEGAVKFVTEHAVVAQRLVMLLQKVFAVHAKVEVRQHSITTFHLTVDRDVDRMLSELGIEQQFRINYHLLREECCMKAFLRGAFFSCGSITDPEKNYHMEFVTFRRQLSQDFLSLLSELGIDARISIRKSNYVIYVKSGEVIGEVLILMGATGALMEFENIRIVKEVNNASNRAVNCDMANVDRQIKAAGRQQRAIEKLTAAHAVLSPELQEFCRVRLENPNASLEELGRLMDPPLSKSGANHRMRKILKLANEIDEGSK